MEIPKHQRYSSDDAARPYPSPNNMGCQAAVAASKLSKHPQYTVGAAIKKGGRLLSLGFNQNKTSAMLYQKFKYSKVPCDKLHAEMTAIIKARCDVRGAKIFIARSKSQGELGMSRPCNLCMSMIAEAGIKEIIYSTDSGWFSERM